MKRNKISYLLRFFVIAIFNILFKLGDLTFSSAFEPSFRSLLFSFYFIVFWLLIWEICSILYAKLFKFTPDKRIWYRRLSVITVVLLMVVTLGALIFNWGYSLFDYYIFGNATQMDVPFINPEFYNPSGIFKYIKINPELLFGIILLFTLVYGAHIFIVSMRNVKEMEVIAAQQKKESITAQYNALKNQIDPHFFFNSLSVLSSLIYESTEQSASYISHLSKHYRYILETNSDNLVTVEKELEYLDSYIFLMMMRHQDLICLKVDLSKQTRSNCMILPHALQMLVENAIKHNTFKKESQLIIEILEDDRYILVRNKVSKRKLLYESTGIGLQNISKRYAIECDMNVVIEDSNNMFVVKLPKII